MLLGVQIWDVPRYSEKPRLYIPTLHIDAVSKLRLIMLLGIFMVQLNKNFLWNWHQLVKKQRYRCLKKKLEGMQIVDLPILRVPGNKATRYHAVLLVPLTTLPKFGSSRELLRRGDCLKCQSEIHWAFSEFCCEMTPPGWEVEIPWLLIVLWVEFSSHTASQLMYWPLWHVTLVSPLAPRCHHNLN